MKHSNRSILILTSGLCLFAGLLWFNRYALAKLYYMRIYFKNSPAKYIKQHEKLFMEDREILGRYELFYPSKGSKDAGAYLNHMVRWEIGQVAHRGSLVLPEFIHKELNEDWITKKPLFKKMGISFKWMKDLLQYDYWNPEEYSPAYPEGQKYSTYAFPVPSYKDLITWGKLRYLHAKETGDVQNALKEVRHLMRLIWTNDYYISSMIVVNMLKIENQFAEILDIDQTTEWEFIPHDHLMRAKRHFYSLQSVVDVRLPDETFDKMVKTNVGLCHMLFQGVMPYIEMKDFLSEELSYGMKRMGRTIAVSNCRKNILHDILVDPNWRTHPKIEGIKILGKEINFQDLTENPDLKAALGYKLINSDVTNYFQYGIEEEEPKKL